jgi:hypothetical protein
MAKLYSESSDPGRQIRKTEADKPMSGEKKIFVNKTGYATIVCPHCGLVKNSHLAKFRSKNNKVNVRCKCGLAFMIQLDFRQHYRKETNLPANFSQLRPPPPKAPGLTAGNGFSKKTNCRIVNLSKSGLRLMLLPELGRISNILPIGSILRINFVLDDKASTEIEYEAKVVAEDGVFRGCFFLDTTAHEKALGFYLLP